MSMDDIPLWGLAVATFGIVTLAMESGYLLGGSSHRRSEDEKESPVSAIAGAILGLLAFMLAFTFSIVADRFDARKGLVRDEANLIRTAFARSEFLPEGDRTEAAELLRQYVDCRVGAAQSGDPAEIQQALVKSQQIQSRLWSMAVANARKDMNSDVAALYVEALNEMVAVHSLRVAVGLQARVPTGIWLALYALVILGMISVGYQTGIAASKRSLAAPVLALSFTIVLTLIAVLDNPRNNYIPVSQQPLMDLRAAMDPPR